MIILESGGIKNLILLILVVLFTGIIAWQWLSSDPFVSVKSETDNNFLVEVTEETNDSFDEIKNSFDKGTEELKTFNENIDKQAKQEQLLEEAQKYLEDKVDINDWENYINDRYYFSINIPSGYQSRAVYEDIDVPLESDMYGFYLVNNDKSIRMDTEDKILYEEDGELIKILAQRAEKYGHKIIKINDIILYQNDSFPENGKTISTVRGDKVLLFSFSNVEQGIIDAMINTLKFTD